LTKQHPNIKDTATIKTNRREKEIVEGRDENVETNRESEAKKGRNGCGDD
jgi:hypothetical protein